MTKVTIELFAGQKKYCVRQIVQDLFMEAEVKLEENDRITFQLSRNLSRPDLALLEPFGAVSMSTSGAGTTGLVL